MVLFLDFGNCPISKKDHLISEMKILLSEMKLHPRVFPPQSNFIPEAKNIYSKHIWNTTLRLERNGSGTILGPEESILGLEEFILEMEESIFGLEESILGPFRAVSYTHLTLPTKRIV